MKKLKYDDHGKKWLTVRTWNKYQPPSRMMNKNGRYKWVRDHTSKLDDYDYQQLTGLERSIFEGICLLVGTRPKRSVPNDPTWIAHALHLVRGDIPHVGRSLNNIISRQFLLRSEVEDAPQSEVDFEDEEESTTPSRHLHDTVTAPSRDSHDTVTIPSRDSHGTVTIPSQHLENASIDGEIFSEVQKKRGREREGELEGDRETVVSQSVSQLVSECSPKPQGSPFVGSLKVIMDSLYPRFNPDFASIQTQVPELQEVSGALDESGWKDFFKWNRTHKPEALIFRSLPQFLAGVGYALNDYTAHDAVSCKECKPKGKEKGARA